MKSAGCKFFHSPLYTGIVLSSDILYRDHETSFSPAVEDVLDKPGNIFSRTNVFSRVKCIPDHCKENFQIKQGLNGNNMCVSFIVKEVGEKRH